MYYVVTALLLLCACSCASAQDLPLIDSALAQVGMTHADVRFDQDEMATWGGNRWRLTYFTMLHQNPFKLPKYGAVTLEALASAGGNIASLVADAGRKIDCPVRRGLIGDPLEKYTQTAGQPGGKSLARSFEVLPAPNYDQLNEKIGLLIALTQDKEFSFNRAYGSIDGESRRQTFQFFVADSQKYNDLVEAYAESVDFNRLIGGAEDIAEALRRLADSLEFCNFPEQRLELPTAAGLVVIGTAAADDYDYTDPPLLILDPGGDDRYRISGFPSHYPLTAILDVAGQDSYSSTDSTSPGIGGAVFGMAVVIDKSGNDTYDAVNVAQGGGIFGVGIVLDNEGDDHYRAKGFAQGCGIFGAGILSDGTGNDSLYCWQTSQGYGYTRGCGMCLNAAGNDVYIAEDSILFSPGQQTQEHNSSLAQGVGFGKRADYLDGHSWAGGVGILCDLAGDDRYRAGLFAQGCGYWFALGMLLDGAGNDDYYSVWYTLGSGAHFAIGYLDDFQGDDTYNATMNMSIGSGHDFTIGYLNERAGNDVYLAPGLSLGGGNFQGIGIFHDWAGDDRYTATGGFNVGGARGLDQGARRYLNTFGVFVDGGGNDSYRGTSASNHRRWISLKPDSTGPGPYEIGVGIDR